MGIAEHSIVTFRVFGDDLIPSEVTALLGCKPTTACSKGEVRIGKKAGKRYTEKTGLWMLSADDKYPEDIPAQITEILNKLTNDPAVWSQLRSRYNMDFFCGMFMGSSNDGLDFSSDILAQLSVRGIALFLDIYDHSDD